MMFFLSFMFIFITQIQPYKTRFCLDCKYCILDVINSKFSHCQKFPIKREDDFFLVSGVSSFQETEYMFCANARSNILLCGPFGLFYKNLTNDKDVL